MTNALCEELESRIRRKQGPFPENTPRILVTGTPMALPNWKLHHAVETFGGVVVCEENCTGTRYFEHLVEEVSGGLEAKLHALAERYMKANCACFTPNTGRIDDLRRMVDEYRADGVIDVSLLFCGLYATESYLVRNALEQKGVPVLHVETDYSRQDVEQMRTRVEAFIEMLR